MRHLTSAGLLTLCIFSAVIGGGTATTYADYVVKVVGVHPPKPALVRPAECVFADTAAFKAMLASKLAGNAVACPDMRLWDTSKVTNMDDIFYQKDWCCFDLSPNSYNDISGWNTSSVTSMVQMFTRTVFTDGKQPDLSKWDTSKVTNMRSMFRSSNIVDSGIGSWDVSSVKTMSRMFEGPVTVIDPTQPTDPYDHPFNGDIGGWNTSSLEYCDSMFQGSLFNQNIGAWDMSKVISTKKMFSSSSFNQDLKWWDMSQVTIIDAMFRSNYVFDQDLSLWDIRNVASFNAASMFFDNPMKEKTAQHPDPNTAPNRPPRPPTSQIYTPGKVNVQVVALESTSTTCLRQLTVDECESFRRSNDNIYGSFYVRHIQNAEYANLGQGCFVIYWGGPSKNVIYNSPGAQARTLASWESVQTNVCFTEATPRVMPPLTLPAACTIANNTEFNTRLTDYFTTASPSCYMRDWNVSAVTNMEAAFTAKQNLDVGITSVNDISNWDVSSVTNMKNMFRHTTFASGKEPELHLWDTSKVTNMEAMFMNSSLVNGNIGAWNTKNVISFYFMFADNVVFNADIGGWDVSSAIDMIAMFTGASVFNQNIAAWDVSKVLWMNDMFNGATSFNQDIRWWNTASLTRMSGMFKGISQEAPNAFDQDLSLWDASKVIAAGLGVFQYSAMESKTAQFPAYGQAAPNRPPPPPAADIYTPNPPGRKYVISVFESDGVTVFGGVDQQVNPIIAIPVAATVRFENMSPFPFQLKDGQVTVIAALEQDAVSAMIVETQKVTLQYSATEVPTAAGMLSFVERTAQTVAPLQNTLETLKNTTDHQVDDASPATSCQEEGFADLSEAQCRTLSMSVRAGLMSDFPASPISDATVPVGCYIQTSTLIMSYNPGTVGSKPAYTTSLCGGSLADVVRQVAISAAANNTESAITAALLDAAEAAAAGGTVDETTVVLPKTTTDTILAPIANDTTKAIGIRKRDLQYLLKTINLASKRGRTQRVKAVRVNVDTLSAVFPDVVAANKTDIDVYAPGDSIKMNQPNYASGGSVGVYVPLSEAGESVTLAESQCKVTNKGPVSGSDPTITYDIECPGQATQTKQEGETGSVSISTADINIDFSFRLGSLVVSTYTQSIPDPAISCGEMNTTYVNSGCCGLSQVEYNYKEVVQRYRHHNGRTVSTCRDLQGEYTASCSGCSAQRL